VEQRGRIPSLDLLATLLLVQPRGWVKSKALYFFLMELNKQREMKSTEENVELL